MTPVECVLTVSQHSQTCCVCPICLIWCAGGLAVLVTALSKDGRWANYTATFLLSRINKLHMVPEQLTPSLTLLGRMQGVLHLSRLLCPEISIGETASIALGG